jgi:hypothetical protein
MNLFIYFVKITMVQVIEEVDNYLQYLLDKYFVFHELAELDEANTIDDISILKCKITNTIKKVTDNNMTSLTKTVVSTFKCYNIGVKNESGGFGDRLNSEESEKIYLHYKKYKSSAVRETETYLTSNPEIDTKDTYYVDSLDTVTTQELQNIFGDFLKSGSKNDKFRYEYRFEFITDGKKYKFSLYDYINDNNSFYDTDDIYWHIASDTCKNDIVNLFKDNLITRLSETDCC